MSDVLLVDQDDILLVQDQANPQVIEAEALPAVIVVVGDETDMVTVEQDDLLLVEGEVIPDLIDASSDIHIITVGEAGPPGHANLAAVASPTGVTVTSDTGTDAVLPAADGVNAGLMLPAQVTKLAGIATGATANSSDATLLARANHTGTQAASTISDFAATVRATVLTGLSLAAATVVDATHTILQAIGFLQKQVSDNLSTLTTHTGNTSNPHGVTAAQAGAVGANGAITGATKTKLTYDTKGLVTSGADATTADIADSTNKRYVTDAQSTVLGNTSNTNSGDQDLSWVLSFAAAHG